MKKLLAIFSSVSMIPGSLHLTAMRQIADNQIQTAYKLDSFKNLVRIVNDKFNDNSKNMDSDYMDKVLDGFSPLFYFNSINKRAGEVQVWDSHPRNDLRTIKTYQNTYTNDSSLVQKRLTQSRTEKISETHNFSITISERVTSGIENTVEGKITVPIGHISDTISFKFGNENGTERNWNESKTTSIEETIPSQEILQNPRTILYVTYKVTQGTWDYKGIARFKIDDLKDEIFRLPLFYFNTKGFINHIIWNQYSMKKILEILRETGHEKELDVNQTDKYSILSVDNIESSSGVFLNLPINWSSPSSGINLEHYEKPLQ